MKTRRFLLFLISSFPFVFLSCNLGHEPGQYDISFGILPLRAGNSWEYFQSTLDTSGHVRDTSSVTITVSGPDSIGSFKGFRIHNLFFWFINPVMFANYADGLYTANMPQLIWDPAPPPSIEKTISYPTFVGDTLTYSGYKIRTRSLRESISVIGGRFECIAYDILNGPDTLGGLWMKPNVGIIKAWQQIGVSTQVNELRSYKLN